MIYGFKAGNVILFSPNTSVFSTTPTGKRPSGRSRRKWADNVRVDLKEIGINTRNWVD